MEAKKEAVEKKRLEALAKEGEEGKKKGKGKKKAPKQSTNMMSFFSKKKK